MTLDPDLQAIKDKIDTPDNLQPSEPLTHDEQRLVTQALFQSQRHRDSNAGATPSRFRRELDFFMVCLGYCLLAFAILVTLDWNSSAPLEGPGIFGLAFLTGLSGAVLRAHYVRQSAHVAGGVRLGIAWAVLVGSLIGLIVAGAISAVIGIAVGAMFFQALMRYRCAPSRDTAEPATEAPRA